MSNDINDILMKDSLTLMPKEAMMNNKTTVEYGPKLSPMSKGMERVVVKALKLDNKDACLLLKDDVVELFNQYAEIKGYMPTEWKEYLALVEDEDESLAI